jgi:2-methylcitrate dehydratase PrpD
MATVSETLADWLADLDPAAIPGDAATGVINTVIDTVALAFAARKTDYIAALRTGWQAAPGDATLFGHVGTSDAITAAMVNGTAAHGEDFDNSYEGCPVHSGAVIVPAVLAVAEARGLSGARAFAGITAGIEIMCRMGAVAGTGVHKAGFHPTAVIGAMAAAAGVGVTLGLDRAALARSFGLAGSMASGIIEYLADGSWAKRMHAGWAAQAGIRAAELGAAGFAGPLSVFEGTHGFYAAFAPTTQADFKMLTGELGSRWEAAQLSFKPYACGTMCQPFVDCAIDLARQGITAADITAINCKVGEGTVHRLWEPLDQKLRPPTAYGAKFSGPYCIAVGLVDGDAGLAQFTDAKINDPIVQALTDKVAYEIDPDNEYPQNYTGHIRATLHDGRVIEAFQPHLRGGTHDPMTRDQITVKARANLAYGGMAADKAEAMIKLCGGLRELPDLSGFSALRGA